MSEKSKLLQEKFQIPEEAARTQCSFSLSEMRRPFLGATGTAHCYLLPLAHRVVSHTLAGQLFKY